MPAKILMMTDDPILSSLGRYASHLSRVLHRFLRGRLTIGINTSSLLPFLSFRIFLHQTTAVTEQRCCPVFGCATFDLELMAHFRTLQCFLDTCHRKQYAKNGESPTLDFLVSPLKIKKRPFGLLSHYIDLGLRRPYLRDGQAGT